MTVRILFENQADAGVLTDCADEAEFIDELSEELWMEVLRSITTQFGVFHIDDDKQEKQMRQVTWVDDYQYLGGIAFSEGHEVVAPVLARAFEIIAKYRGYKSDVKEKRHLYSGSDFPSISVTSIEDETKATPTIAPPELAD